MLLGIDPKIDFAFKFLFGRETTGNILIDVVNCVLQPPADRRIEHIELLNPFNVQDSLDDKLSVLDVKARDQAGRRYNIEMQMLAFLGFDKRLLYYWSGMYQEQLHEGDDYGSLQPTISISFLNHILFPDVSDHHLRFRLLEERHHFAMSDDVEFHILELPKFTTPLGELSNGLDAWLYFLRFAEKIDAAALPAQLQRPAIVRAVEELTMLTQADVERERYESRRKAQLDTMTAINSARKEGEKIGREKGQRLGVQVGAIHLLQRMLSQAPTPAAQLEALSLEELTRMAADLEKQALG